MSRLSTILNDQVFIGNLTAAEDVNMLRELDIGCVLSIGCCCNVYKDNLLPTLTLSDESLMTESPYSRSTSVPNKYIHYSDIPDTAETPLLHIFPYTNDLIRSCVYNGSKVLVHCVYGQSRSATVIVAYMLSIGYELTAAMKTMKSLHPDICINPGFLAQLYLVSVADFSSAEYRLVTYALSNSSAVVRNESDKKKSMFEPTAYWNGRKVDSLASGQNIGTVGVKRKQSSHNMDSCVGRDANHVDNEHGTICCRSCKTALAPERDIVSRDLSSAISSFLEEYLDDFWKGYRPAWAYYKKQSKSAKKDKKQALSSSGYHTNANLTSQPTERHASANSGQDQQMHQSRSVIDESIFVRFDSMDEEEEDDYDDDEEEEGEDGYRGGDEEQEQGEVFSNLSCRTSKNDSLGGSCSSSSSDIFGMEQASTRHFMEISKMSRAGELTSCMSVTSSELDSTSDKHHHHHHRQPLQQQQQQQQQQQHSSGEVGSLPGRGSAASPFLAIRSPPPVKGNPLGLVPNHVVTVPQDWMLKQVIHMMGESGQGTLWCPGCASVCGYWKQGALQILGEFNLCDAFALQESCIRLKRRTRHKIL